MVENSWRQPLAEATGVPQPLIGIGGGCRSTADLRSRLPVEDIAIASVGATLTMAAELQRQRTTALSPAIQSDASHVAAAFRSDVHLRMNGQHAADRRWEPSNLVVHTRCRSGHGLGTLRSGLRFCHFVSSPSSSACTK